MPRVACHGARGSRDRARASTIAATMAATTSRMRRRSLPRRAAAAACRNIRSILAISAEACLRNGVDVRRPVRASGDSSCQSMLSTSLHANAEAAAAQESSLSSPQIGCGTSSQGGMLIARIFPMLRRCWRSRRSAMRSRLLRTARPAPSGPGDHIVLGHACGSPRRGRGVDRAADSIGPLGCFASPLLGMRARRRTKAQPSSREPSAAAHGAGAGRWHRALSRQYFGPVSSGPDRCDVAFHIAGHPTKPPQSHLRLISDFVSGGRGESRWHR